METTVAEPRLSCSGISNVHFGDNVRVVQPVNLYGCTVGDDSFVGPFVEIQRNVVIGKRCKIQSHAFVCELVTIGDDCVISHGAKFINDPFAIGGPAQGDRRLWRRTRLGDHVSIGTNATILPVSICDHVVIGAGSVVTKDITEPGIYAGNPARLLRRLNPTNESETIVNVPFVDLHAQYLSIRDDIDTAISKVIAESAFIRGPHVETFERAWADTVGVKHCVSCANGTDALLIAMRGLGVKPGDEVITAANSWISTSAMITQAGGRVVFCDVDPVTFTIDPAQLESKITSRTVGIIPVHLYGQAADMDPIMAIAERHGLWVVEDCAQAHLARYKDRVVGTFGTAATYSFYPSKNLGAYGDAGCIVTNDDQLAEWMAAFARHGGKNEHVMEAINSRMDGLQAAILQAKLPHLPAWTKARRRLAWDYDSLLKGIGDVATPQVGAWREHVYHLYVIRTARRDALKTHLGAAGVATVLNYPKALPFYPAYAYLGHKPEDFPVAYRNQSRILSLPMYPEMPAEMLHHVTNEIRRFFDAS
jgi:dTDP-4-amino-4,6-dideoxygalactose transaminase/acetyltransferase-like isoleucine patch superfamily enzyme